MRPLCTAAFCSMTCRPVMPRSVRLARSRPVRKGASKLLADPAVILLTRATLMAISLYEAWGPESAPPWESDGDGGWSMKGERQSNRVRDDHAERCQGII